MNSVTEMCACRKRQFSRPCSNSLKLLNSESFFGVLVLVGFKCFYLNVFYVVENESSENLNLCSSMSLKILYKYFALHASTFTIYHAHTVQLFSYPFFALSG